MLERSKTLGEEGKNMRRMGERKEIILERKGMGISRGGKRKEIRSHKGGDYLGKGKRNTEGGKMGRDRKIKI